MRTILQLVGSPTSAFYCELSELYARGCIDALGHDGCYRFVIAHVSPDGRWRLPTALTDAALKQAKPLGFAQAMNGLAGLPIDAAVPQMFCERGVAEYRALLELLELPYLGNRPLQMAIAADKSKAKAIVAAAGIATPPSERLGPDQSPTLAPPVVIKPNNAGNSDGIGLARSRDEYEAALKNAREHGDDILVERYIELGREVRCGVVEHRSELLCLPLEEYNVNPATRPIRNRSDKLQRGADEALNLAAKNAESSWIVAADDPINEPVWAAARACHRALGLRHYGLFDFRIDPDGRPWFLEAGPYCSFSPQSVVVTMMQAAGHSLEDFFATALEDWVNVPDQTRPRYWSKTV